MKIVFLGPPNSGKGTYAKRVAPKLGLTYISTSGLFFEAAEKGLEYGKKAVEFINSGKPVPNEISAGVIIDRVTQPDCENGFILDTPYNKEQAELVDQNEKTKVDAVINIVVPEEVLKRRGTSRIICKECKQIYNKLSLKPKEEGKCDKCGGELFQREDDKEEKIKVRLEEYRNRAGPLEEYYKERGILINIEWKKEYIPEGDIDIPIEFMLEHILEKLKNLQNK